MIIGLGLDLVDIDRIRRSLDRFGDSFLEKLLHETERAALPEIRDKEKARTAMRVAGRFAAKEAGAKALGTGFAEGIGLHDIRIGSLPSGKPELTFHGAAEDRARRLGVSAVHLSITHTETGAAAVVVLEGTSGGETAP